MPSAPRQERGNDVRVVREVGAEYQPLGVTLAAVRLHHHQFELPNTAGSRETLRLPPEIELIGESTVVDTLPTAFHT